MFVHTLLAAAAISAMSALSASAATVTIAVESFGTGAANIAAARAQQSAFHGSGQRIVENFEGFQLQATTQVQGGGAADSFSAATIETKVGDFTSINPAGSGTTDLNPTGQLHVRDGSGNDGGRFNTTLGGFNYLDSNDNSGIFWSIPGSAALRPIDRISFLATDIDDVGAATFNVSAGGDVLATKFSLASELLGKRPNGELLLFTLLFDSVVSNLTIAMNIDKGDGFSIDDVTVGQVPLPAAAWMLLAGLGGLAALGRRRSAA